ncbi:hypothetical protein GJ496_009664 [Pomphorhynchus laevis]|nr:hypothetical protein GJ496_009664 [Pomphorhynchus laevis]
MWSKGNLGEIIKRVKYHQAKILVQMNGLTPKQRKYTVRITKFIRMDWIGKASKLLMNENSGASLLSLDQMIVGTTVCEFEAILMTLRMRTKAEQVLFSNEDIICSSA